MTDNTLLSPGEQQYRFAHNPLAHQLFHTFKSMVVERGVDAALADVAEAQAADRKKYELQARIDEWKSMGDFLTKADKEALSREFLDLYRLHGERLKAEREAL